MRRLLPLLLLLATACGPPPDVPLHVTSRAPERTFDCIAPHLEALPVRHETRRSADGWRMDLFAFAGPPAGWYRRGTIEHSDNVVLFAPDGATAGIRLETPAQSEIRDILRRCAPER
ncbi:hypothetical protein [Tropicimonas sp.]|uniref:hypothetical protein n=1 Tax=Tropicimonas sp. TaxID=2067044 RepID=UPI003A84A55C